MTDNGYHYLAYAREWAHNLATSDTLNIHPHLLQVAKAINGLPEIIVDGEDIQDVIDDLSNQVDSIEGLEGELREGYVAASTRAINKLTKVITPPRTLADMDIFESNSFVDANVYIKTEDSFLASRAWQLVGVNHDTGAILYRYDRDVLPQIKTFPLSSLIPEFDEKDYNPRHLYSDNEGNIWGHCVDQWVRGETEQARKDQYINGHGHDSLPDKFAPYTQVA